MTLRTTTKCPNKTILIKKEKSKQAGKMSNDLNYAPLTHTYHSKISLSIFSEMEQEVLELFI